MEKAIKLSQLVGLKKVAAEFSSLGNDYIFSRLTSEAPTHAYDGPFRVDGYTWVLCLRGKMEVGINLDRCSLEENTMMVTGPDSILSLRHVAPEAMDSYLLFISSDFMRDTNIDPNVLHHTAANYPVHRPTMKILPEEGELVKRYFDLIHHNTQGNSDDIYVRSISRCLISALCYQMLQIVHNHHRMEENQRPRSRRTTYVHEFMALLHENRMKERSVGFYARKLFISPKYLSLIIKEATGRSAAEWIDEYVILEAKNLLRFSGKNIQQVAYELNFPNQSSFGKYFKHLTGMSPSAYQRS